MFVELGASEEVVRAEAVVEVKEVVLLRAWAPARGLPPSSIGVLLKLIQGRGVEVLVEMGSKGKKGMATNLCKMSAFFHFSLFGASCKSKHYTGLRVH